MSIRAQFDPESGVLLQEGDPGYQPLSEPLPKGNSLGGVQDPTARASAIRQAQANDTVKAREAQRFARLVAVAAHQAPPGPIAHGYVAVGGKPYAPDLDAHPREATRQAAIAAWGGGTVTGPIDGPQYMAERAEREQIAFQLRRQEALFVLSATSPAERDLPARPLRARALFDYSGLA